MTAPANVEIGAGHCQLTTHRPTFEVGADAVKRFAAANGQVERRARAGIVLAN